MVHQGKKERDVDLQSEYRTGGAELDTTDGGFCVTNLKRASIKIGETGFMQVETIRAYELIIGWC